MDLALYDKLSEDGKFMMIIDVAYLRNHIEEIKKAVDKMALMLLDILFGDV